MYTNYSTMNSNNWMNLFQQGLGMFGFNNSFGSFGQFGSMSMNGSLFNYNIDYDAMAGYAVANSVLGVVGQAVSSSKAEKQAEKQEYKNSSARLKEIDNDIRHQQEIKTNNDTEIKNQRSKISQADESKAKLEGEIKSLNIGTLQVAYNNIKDSKNPEDATKIDEAKKALEDAQKKEKELKKKVSDLEDCKSQAQEKINLLQNQKTEADSKIKDLEAEKEKLQNLVDSHDLDAANGTKLSRTSDKEYEKLLDENGNAMKNQRYSKADVKTAVDRFMQAVGDDKKLQAAKNLVEMFNNCPNWTGTLQNAAKVAQRYVKEHKE